MTTEFGWIRRISPGRTWLFEGGRRGGGTIFAGLAGGLSAEFAGLLEGIGVRPWNL